MLWWDRHDVNRNAVFDLLAQDKVRCLAPLPDGNAKERAFAKEVPGMHRAGHGSLHSGLKLYATYLIFTL
ncbi:MAG: hypothetical protein WC655_05275, partial [Candidatus Hydrogenedentales bacterium]